MVLYKELVSVTRYVYKAACRKTNCQNDYFPDKWGKMEATRKGWFIHRNGSAWCPDHIPDWVVEWREKKAKG